MYTKRLPFTTEMKLRGKAHVSYTFRKCFFFLVQVVLIEKQNLNKSISWLATTLPEVRCRLAFAYISCRARQKRIPQDFIQEQTTPYRLPKDCQQLLFDSPFMTAQTSKL